MGLFLTSPEEQTGLTLCEQLHPSAWVWMCACLCPSSLWVHLWIQTCELRQHFILFYFFFFSIRSYSVTRFVQGQINLSPPTYGTAGSCCAGMGHPHSHAGMGHPHSVLLSGSLAALSLVPVPGLLWANLPWSLMAPSVCPTRMVRSYQSTRRSPSVQDYIHLSMAVVCLPFGLTTTDLDPRSPLNSSEICACSCCFQNLQLCTWCTSGCSWPGHSWCTNNWTSLVFVFHQQG